MFKYSDLQSSLLSGAGDFRAGEDEARMRVVLRRGGRDIYSNIYYVLNVWINYVY